MILEASPCSSVKMATNRSENALKENEGVMLLTVGGETYCTDAETSQSQSFLVDTVAITMMYQLFPVPTFLKLTVNKGYTEQVGLRLTDDGLHHQVIVVEILEGSPFLNTTLSPGSRIVSINGESFINVLECVSLLRSCTGEVTLEFFPDGTLPEFLKVASFACRNRPPGLSFLDIRNNCLVQVSRVFSRSPAREQIQEGDILLAVNDSPVKSGDHAKRLLMEASQDMNSCVNLYLVQLTSLVNLAFKTACTQFRCDSSQRYEFSPIQETQWPYKTFLLKLHFKSKERQARLSFTPDTLELIHSGPWFDAPNWVEYHSLSDLNNMWNEKLRHIEEELNAYHWGQTSTFPAPLQSSCTEDTPLATAVKILT